MLILRPQPGRFLLRVLKKKKKKKWKVGLEGILSGKVPGRAGWYWHRQAPENRLSRVRLWMIFAQPIKPDALWRAAEVQFWPERRPPGTLLSRVARRAGRTSLEGGEPASRSREFLRAGARSGPG